MIKYIPHTVPLHLRYQTRPRAPRTPRSRQPPQTHPRTRPIARVPDSARSRYCPGLSSTRWPASADATVNNRHQSDISPDKPNHPHWGRHESETYVYVHKRLAPAVQRARELPVVRNIPYVDFVRRGIRRACVPPSQQPARGCGEKREKRDAHRRRATRHPGYTTQHATLSS